MISLQKIRPKFNIFLSILLVLGQLFPILTIRVTPALADFTLGFNGIGASTDGGSSANNISGARFTNGATAGSVTSMSVYMGAVDATNKSFQLAIYSDSAGAPGTLIASSSTGTLVANSWNTVSVSASVAANASYWLMYNSNGANNHLRYDIGSSNQSGYKSQTFGTWPSSAGAFSLENLKVSIYATVTTDATAPTVAITDPTEGASVVGNATITASASDNVGVVGVQFKLDGANLGSEDTSSPYSTSWDTTSLVDAGHTLSAVARDAAGNSTTSTIVNVTTHNPAKLKITAPTNGGSVSGTTVNVTYSKAGDMTTEANHAHFRLDGGATVMDLDFDGSYTFSNVSAGPHTLVGIVARADHTEISGSDDTISFTTVVTDNTPPTVSITAPAGGATVSNTITVTADASDNVGVVGVQFKLDGANLGLEDTNAPYSVSWDTNTTTNSSHTLTAVARDAAANSTTSSPVNVTVSNSGGASLVGQWGASVNWPIVAVHANMMKNGKLLLWDAWETFNTQARVWDPVANTFTTNSVTGGLFCASQAPDKDGNIVVIGGHIDGEEGIKDVTVYNPTTNSWTKKTPMQSARWYPTATTLSDGRVLAMSGQSTVDSWANTPEVVNLTNNTVSQLSSVSTTGVREQQYPYDWQLPSGKVLVVSSEQGGVYTLDVGPQAWTQVGTTPFRWGIGVSFAPNKFLFAGGGTFEGTSQKQASVLDMSSGSAVWAATSQMNVGRAFHNMIMLPTGKVLAVGGSTSVDDASSNGTMTSEMWDPNTGVWTQLANNTKPRMYHSVAILLPDGRVLSAGGGRLSPAPDQLNAEIYSPPYLFQGSRPTITSAPTELVYDQSFTINSPEAGSISKVNLIDLQSLTHDVDGNQHYQELAFTTSGLDLTVTPPQSSNYLPAGYYYLTIVNSSGVPSVSKIIHLDNPVGGGPTPTPTPTSGPTPTPTTVPTSTPTPTPTVVPTVTPTPTSGPTPTPTTIPTPTPTAVPTATPTPTSVPTPTPTSVPGSTLSLWPSTNPTNFDLTDTASVELGVKFKSSVAGYIKGIRFYRHAQQTGTFSGSLWNRTGTRLATVNFTSLTPSGWQQVNFASSVAVTANTTYVASYHASAGRYAQHTNYFTSAYTNGTLTALQNGTDGSNGVYRYSSSIVFPNLSYSSSNYWVDVIFSTTP